MKHVWIKGIVWLLILSALGYYQYRLRTIEEDSRRLTAENEAMESYLHEMEKKPEPRANQKEKINRSSTQTDVATANDAAWKDGIYEGTGQGFGGKIQVSVCIRDGRIEQIEVLSHEHEDDAYFSMAKDLIAMQLQNQTGDVDVVSGATYSSNGIIEAVKDALEKAIE